MNQTNKSILRKSKVKKKKNICRIGNSKYEDWLFNWEKMKKKKWQLYKQGVILLYKIKTKLGLTT